MKQAILKNKSLFMEREIRVFKATTKAKTPRDMKLLKLKQRKTEQGSYEGKRAVPSLATATRAQIKLAKRKALSRVRKEKKKLNRK